MMDEDVLATKLKLEERTLTQEEQEKVGNLLKYLNFIIEEVVSEYCPLLCKEKISIVDGKFDLSSLSKTFAYVKSLKNDSGVNLKYKIYGENLFAGEKEAIIEYCYIPDDFIEYCVSWVDDAGEHVEDDLRFKRVCSHD